MRRSFLSGLLEETAAGHDKVEFENFLRNLKNTVGGMAPSEVISPGTVADGDEQVAFAAKVDVILDGSQLTCFKPDNKPACFKVVVTNKCFYLADLTFPSHPQVPLIARGFPRAHGDVTRLVKGVLPQYLVIGWAV